MRESTRVNNRGSDMLFMVSCVLCTLYIIMSVLSAGVSVFSPQVYILGGLSLAAMLSGVLSRLLCNGLVLPPKRVIFVILLSVVVVTLSVMNAVVFNYGYSAKSMGFVWASGVLVFIAILLTARDRSVFRLYASAIASSVVIVGIYALYQKIYALDYLHSIASDSAAFKDSIRSKGMVVAQAFIDRIEDGWVGGGFNSDAALCAFALLFSFFIFGVRNRERVGAFFELALFTGLICIVISGSWYGLLIGKVLEVVVLYKSLHSNLSWVKRLLLVLGGVGVLSLLGSLLGVGLWLATGSVVAEIAFAFLWYVEIEVLRRRYCFETYKNVEYLVGIGFLAVFVLIIATVIVASNTSDLGLFRDFLRYYIYESSFSMVAAWQAFLDAPIFGWGLDNFSEIHSTYKYPVGNSLGRAGNLYLEMLADGGLVLLGVFMLSIGVMLFSNVVERREHREVDFEADRFKIVGSYLIIIGFFTSFLLVILGLSEHMGLEYFLREITTSPESFLARGISVTPLIVHFLINIIILPITGVIVFRHFWLMSRGMDYSGIVYYLRISIIAFLVYAIAGDYLFHPVLSGLFWVMLGLFLARQQAWGMLSFRLRIRKILAYLFLLAGITWGTWGVWEGLVSSAAGSMAIASARRYEDIEQTELALRAFDTAISVSESNAELYIGRANILLQIYEMNKNNVSSDSLDGVISGINKALEIRPNSSEYRVALARVLAKYYPIEYKKDIFELFSTAQKMYPYNAKYPYLFAKYLYDIGELEEAKNQAEKAIEIDSLYEYDNSTKLRKYEIYKARGIASSISE